MTSAPLPTPKWLHGLAFLEGWVSLLLLVLALVVAAVTIVA